MLSFYRLSRFLRPPHTTASLSTATAAEASTTTTTTASPPVESRWRRLKRERRLRPTPANRTPSFDRTAPHSLSDALQLVRSSAWAKFDESLELVFRLNIDPRLTSENIRGFYCLPHGTGRPTKVAVFAEGQGVRQAKQAGAELVGGEDWIDQLKLEKGKSLKGFAACAAMPHLLPKAAQKLGKILGPKGLLPSVKDGTVGDDIGHIVERLKSGQVKYRTDKQGNVHLIVGKLSFADDCLIENVRAATLAIIEAKPASVKKKYMKNAVLCSSMGPGITLSIESLGAEAMGR